MRRKRIYGIIVGAVAALFSGVPAAGQQTKLLTADRHNEYGLVYMLPNTVLDIEVTAERTVRKAGKYFRYAKKYIGRDDVIKDDSESWRITSVKVGSYGTPDNESRYLMQLKPGALTYLCVDANGMLLAVNKEIELPGYNGITRGDGFAEEVSKSGGGVGMKDYLKYVDEDFLASQSSAKQAQMLAENLLDIRDSRISLTRGTAESMPTDGRQLELMLDNLAQQEAAITAAFCGTEEKTVFRRTYSFMPREDEGRKVLFRMSDFAGFVGPDDLSGDPVYITVTPGEEPSLPVDAKGEVKKVPKDAVMYCLPGSGTVTMTYQGAVLFEKDMEFSQFGVTFGLSPSLFTDKKNPSYAVFDPATGALKEIGENARE